MKKTVHSKKRAMKVLKFGGTCLHPLRNRRRVVDRIKEEEREGHAVVAVVSAMGRLGDPYATDTLEELLPDHLPAADRERDALLSCGEGIAASLLAAELTAEGVAAVSLRGYQLGLITDDRHGNAEVLSVDPRTIRRYLDKGYVVVAAGFQGVGKDGSLFTLGRGGSDTAAVALAAALGADAVVFYKDVEGLFNADPSIVPSARPLPMIPYDEAAHLAYAGARILHPRSADLAEQYDLPIEIKSLWNRERGTLVTSRENIKLKEPKGRELFAVTCLEDIGQLTVRPSKTRTCPDFPRLLFKELAAAGISLDMINLLEGAALFTAASQALDKAARLAEWGGCDVAIRKDCAKVSLLGGGIHGVPGIMSLIISALTEIDVPIYQSVDTYTVISVLVDARHAAGAARALHKAFGLDQA